MIAITEANPEETALAAGYATPAPGVNVLLLFRDDEHEWMGKNCLCHAWRHLGHTAAARMVAWPAERLWSPTCRMLATIDALEANLIVVAAAAHEALAEETRTWIDHWASRKRVGPGTLIAVLSGTQPTEAAIWPDYLPLGEIAAQCGMEYLVYTSGVPAAGEGSFHLTRAPEQKFRTQREARLDGVSLLLR
jgi:hypothetical protein